MYWYAVDVICFVAGELLMMDGVREMSNDWIMILGELSMMDGMREMSDDWIMILGVLLVIDGAGDLEYIYFF